MQFFTTNRQNVNGDKIPPANRNCYMLSRVSWALDGTCVCMRDSTTTGGAAQTVVDSASRRQHHVRVYRRQRGGNRLVPVQSCRDANQWRRRRHTQVRPRLRLQSSDGAADAYPRRRRGYGRLPVSWPEQPHRSLAHHSSPGRRARCRTVRQQQYVGLYTSSATSLWPRRKQERWQGPSEFWVVGKLSKKSFLTENFCPESKILNRKTRFEEIEEKILNFEHLYSHLSKICNFLPRLFFLIHDVAIGYISRVYLLF